MNRISQYSPELNLEWKQPRDTKESLRPARKRRTVADWNVDFKNGPDREFAQNLANHFIQQLSRKARESDGLRKQVEELSRKVERHEKLLANFLDVGSPPPLGEYEQWIEAGADTGKYLGKHVAYLKGHGVLAAADTLDELFEQVEKLGKVNEVTFGFVPSHGG